jgi:hypothetical protein
MSKRPLGDASDDKENEVSKRPQMKHSLMHDEASKLLKFLKASVGITVHLVLCQQASEALGQLSTGLMIEMVENFSTTASLTFPSLP